MELLDIASIVFACTAVNHLGMVKAIEKVIKHEIPVVNCVKCLTFWSVLVYGTIAHYSLFSFNGNLDFSLFTFHSSLTVLAISFLSAWAAIWLDLCMGAVDQLYTKIYDTLYPATNTTNTDTLGTNNTVPDVPDAEEREEDCNEDAAEEEEKQ